MEQPKIFPKLFIGDASRAFMKYLSKNNIAYAISYIYDGDDLKDFINRYSLIHNYNDPIIITDISYLSKKEQSLLLKFMEDTPLKVILLASRDNILDTIISRVKEFRKYYTKENISSGMLNPKIGEEMVYDEIQSTYEADSDISEIDKISLYKKYSPILFYNDNLLKKNYRIPKRFKSKIKSLIEM